jgi:two-component system CheB/CheR fusion protein
MGRETTRNGGQVRRLVLSLLHVTSHVAARRALQGRTAGQRRGVEALPESERGNTEFLGVLSHELRNALAVVRNALWLLDRAPPGSVAAGRARRILDRQVAHLCRMVDDLLDVTRAAHGKLAVRKARVDLVAVVAEAVEDHVALFARRRIRLVRKLGAAPVWLDADATRIAQAVGNLLQNAAKFTRCGGRVEICVAREPRGSALIRVRDDGVGFDPASGARIFEPFAQAHPGGGDGGLGLGLSLVKAVVELHGGSVEARSEGPGRGAEFLVRLPASS